MANTPACALSIPNGVNPVRADWIHRPGLALLTSILIPLISYINIEPEKPFLIHILVFGAIKYT